MKKRCSNLPSAPHGGSGSALYRAETKGVGQHSRYCSRSRLRSVGASAPYLNFRNEGSRKGSPCAIRSWKPAILGPA
jgi:hypothetical protein